MVLALILHMWLHLFLPCKFRLSNFLGISFELSFMSDYLGKGTSTIPQPMINYLAGIRARTGAKRPRESRRQFGRQFNMRGISIMANDSTTLMRSQTISVPLLDPNNRPAQLVGDAKVHSKRPNFPKYTIEVYQTLSSSARQSLAYKIITKNDSVNATPRLVLSEFNSASCRGIPGLSETFKFVAGALWIAEYSLQLASDGYTAAYLHLRERGTTHSLVTPAADAFKFVW
ncbi:hypothetical protein B0H19DRAFT_1065022 [Mycena capillaripes]|nr:hypothetical protein B0H19DRAFT_1065022 [Mycena capillaripes]